MSFSTNPMVPRASARTVSPSPKRSSSPTNSRIWARRWCARSPPKRVIKRATEPRPRSFSRKQSCARAPRPLLGMNPMDLKRGIDRAVDTVVKEIEKRSKKVSTNDEIAQVGTVSANNDSEIGKMIAEAMQKVGNEGVITVEEAKSLETELDVVEGMQFD